MTINVFQPTPNYYKESTAAQLLRPRVDDLVTEGGLDYKELNRRIVAKNRTDDIPVDHNPIYGGISKEVCAVERLESFNIDDKLNSFDKTVYNLFPRKVFLKTSDTSVVTEANGFWGDEIKINVNALLDLLSTQAISLYGLPVEGEFELDKVKLIIDESIKNPWKIDFSDETNIILTVNPLKNNVIPLIFKPEDNKHHGSFVNVSLLILDEREVAVIPEVVEGTYITVEELNTSNASSFKDKKGEVIDVISGTIVGKLLNSETKEELSSVTCDVSVGNKFPELPTSYDMTGVDDVSKRHKTLFANVVIKQSSIRDLNIVLPIVYLSDDRTELVPITSLTIDQSDPIVLTYANSGNTFRGDTCVLDSATVSSSVTVTAEDADSSSVTLTIGEAVVGKALNKDQKSTKATVKITSEDGLISPLTYELEIDDQRPLKAKEHFTVTESFSVTIASTDWNAGNKGQEWSGDSLTVSGSLTKIENQFGKTILPADILLQSFTPIDVNARVLSVTKAPITILASDDVAGSTVAKATLYVLLKDLSVLEIPVELDVTDNR